MIITNANMTAILKARKLTYLLPPPLATWHRGYGGRCIIDWRGHIWSYTPYPAHVRVFRLRAVRLVLLRWLHGVMDCLRASVALFLAGVALMDTWRRAHPEPLPVLLARAGDVTIIEPRQLELWESVA